MHATDSAASVSENNQLDMLMMMMNVALGHITLWL